MKFDMINPMPVPKAVASVNISDKVPGEDFSSDEAGSFPSLLAGEKEITDVVPEVSLDEFVLPEDLETVENTARELSILPGDLIDGEDPVLLPVPGTDDLLDTQDLSEEDAADVLYPLPATPTKENVMPVATLLAERTIDQPVIARATADLLSGNSRLNNDLQMMKAELLRQQASMTSGIQGSGSASPLTVEAGLKAGGTPYGLPLPAGQAATHLVNQPSATQNFHGFTPQLSAVMQAAAPVTSGPFSSGAPGAAISVSADIPQMMPEKPGGVVVTKSEAQVPFLPTMNTSQLPDFISREISTELRAQSRGLEMATSASVSNSATNLKRIEIQLVPKNLGVVEISVQKDTNGIRILVRAETAEAERIISSERSSIQEAMKNAGLSLDEMRVVSLSAPDREQAMRGGKSFDQEFAQEQFDGSLQQSETGESDQRRQENEGQDHVLNENQEPLNPEADYGRRPGIYL